MYDLEQHDGRLVSRERSTPWLRAVAVIAGAVVVHFCGGFFIETDLRDIRGHVAERLAGVVVAMVAVMGASAFVWGLFKPDRRLTFDARRRTVEIVEDRPFRRSRTSTHSFDAIASVDVVAEFGDDDTSHVHLRLRGDDRPVVVREFLDRSEADAISARLRDLLRI